MTTFALGFSESTAISASRSGRGEVDRPLSDILVLRVWTLRMMAVASVFVCLRLNAYVRPLASQGAASRPQVCFSSLYHDLHSATSPPQAHPNHV